MILEVIVIGTVDVHKLIVFVNTHEYVAGALTTKEEEVVFVQTAVVLVPVNADKLRVGVLQVKTPLKGLTV